MLDFIVFYRVQFNKDSNLTFGDEIEAYTSYKAQGSFTPHPGNNCFPNGQSL